MASLPAFTTIQNPIPLELHAENLAHVCDQAAAGSVVAARLVARTKNSQQANKQQVDKDIDPEGQNSTKQLERIYAHSIEETKLNTLTLLDRYVNTDGNSLNAHFIEHHNDEAKLWWSELENLVRDFGKVCDNYSPFFGPRCDRPSRFQTLLNQATFWRLSSANYFSQKEDDRAEVHTLPTTWKDIVLAREILEATSTRMPRPLVPQTLPVQGVDFLAGKNSWFAG